jgi:Ala-tRNA(Pro) deacylase
VKYVVISHSPAYTAQEVAESAHVSGSEFAKTVMVNIDGHLAMAVVPATRDIDLDRLRAAAGASVVTLAAEDEFGPVFPGCELGAMPPFGNLYGLNVYVDRALVADDEMAFNAGSHTDVIRMPFADFQRLVKPHVAVIGQNHRTRVRG